MFASVVALRLSIGLGLYEASRGVAREAIRNRFPNADDATIEEKLRQRIRVGYEIEAASQKKPSPPAPHPKQVWGERSQSLGGPLPMNGARGASEGAAPLPNKFGEGDATGLGKP